MKADASQCKLMDWIGFRRISNTSLINYVYFGLLTSKNLENLELFMFAIVEAFPKISKRSLAILILSVMLSLEKFPFEHKN